MELKAGDIRRYMPKNFEHETCCCELRDPITGFEFLCSIHDADSIVLVLSDKPPVPTYLGTIICLLDTSVVHVLESEFFELFCI
jgi:hypothetical protein